jgi:hypothetical protein
VVGVLVLLLAWQVHHHQSLRAGSDRRAGHS